MPRYREFQLRNERYETADQGDGSGRKRTPEQQAEIDELQAEWDAMQWKIARALEDYPEAKLAVLAALDCAEEVDAESKAGD